MNLVLDLPSPEATADLARAMAPLLRAGDTILLFGAVGAGKSHFARALIQARLAAVGLCEDVPSPTFTLVQTYEAGDCAIWHSDLYRLTDPDEIFELGLDEAFSAAISLIEWPERLGPHAPAGALSLTLTQGPQPDQRRAELTATASRWAPVLAALGVADG